MSLDARTSSPTLRPPAAPPGDDVFARTRFFLRQKHFSLQEQYFVWGENETKLLFVERPRHHARSLLALAGAVGAFLVGTALVIGIGTLATNVFGIGDAAEGIVPLVGALCGAAAAFAAGVALSPKRHISFYRDESKGERLLQVEQDAKVQILNATYTVKDPRGTVLARVTKNMLHDILRKRWTCHDARGRLVCLIKEDSLWKAIFRRFGPLGALLRTNFVFFDGETEIGRFDRQLTLFDRYVLDVEKDARGILDRRVALAIGVLLDTGERR